MTSRITEGLPFGQVLRTGARTLSEGECALLTALTWTIGRFHTDPEFAKTTEFGGIVLAGAVIPAVAAGLIGMSNYYREFETKYGFKVVAVLGMEVRYRHPLRPGDTIRVETILRDARPSGRRPGQGVAEFEDRVLNQRDDVVAEMKRFWLFERTAP